MRAFRTFTSIYRVASRHLHAVSLLSAIAATPVAASPLESTAARAAERAAPRARAPKATPALAPYINISPYNYAVVSTSSITISAEACEWNGSWVWSVDLYFNGNYLTTGYDWNGTGCPYASAYVYLNGTDWNSISAYACNDWGECTWVDSYVRYEPPPPPPPPSITLSPANGTYVYASWVSVQADACDYSWGVSYVYVYVNYNYVGQGESGWWGCMTAYGSGSLSPGWNTISAYACNGWGSCAWVDHSIYFVPPPPAITFSPGNGSYVYSNPYWVSTSGCHSAYGASVIYLYVNSVHVNTGYGSGSCASTGVSASLSAGWNTISATACNAWGNCSSASASIYYVPPAPSIAFSPGSGSYVYSSPYYVYSEACSPWGVAYLYLYVNGTHVSTGYGGWGCAGAAAWAYLNPGWNTISAYACNQYSGCGWNSASLHYTPPPPAITFSPGNGATVYSSPSGVSATGCDYSYGTSVVYLYVNSVHVATGYGYGASCASAWANASLSAGWNTVSATACSPYSCGSSSASIYYLPPAPTITFSPAHNATVLTSPSTVSATACSDWGISVLYLYVNNAHVATTSGGTCATASYSAYLAVGSNTVSAHACNGYNNCRTSSATIYRAPPPPYFAFWPGHGETVSTYNPNTIQVEACSPYGGVSVVYLYHNGTHVATGYPEYPNGELGGDPPECVSASASVNLTVGWNTVSAYACNSSQCDSPAIQVYYPPPVYSVSVIASGPATTIPGYPTGAAGFRVIHNGARTGPMRIDFAASCAGVAGAPCSPSPARIDAAYPGDEYFVSVSFGVSPVGTSGSVTLTATPAGGSAQSATASVSPTPVYKASIAQQGQKTTVYRGGVHQVAFSVTNNSDNAAEPLRFTAVSKCDLAVTGCSPASQTVDVARSATGTVTVSFNANGPGTTGTVQLQVSAGGSGVLATGTYDVTVRSAFDVEVRAVNAGTAVDRGECLTIAAGDDAAYECAALRVVHALPTTRTMNKARTPTLLYNSHHAEPTVFVAVNVNYNPPAGAPAPTKLEATLKIQDRPDVVREVPWSPQCAGQWCRIMLRLDQDLLTNLYKYDVHVRELASGASSVPATDTLVIVNRRASPFGAGWWLAGLEQLQFPTTDNSKILWIGGDGSTRLYTRKSETVWEVEPWLDGRDTLSAVSGGGYQRHLPDGTRVVFDGGGQHVRTRNRVGHETVFGYTAVGGRSVLRTITLPTPAGGVERTYIFDHHATAGGPSLFYVHAPDDVGVPRTTTLNHAASGDLRVSSIIDPDGSEVAFGFVYGARVGWRRTRRGDVTSFGYEAVAALARIEHDMRRTNGAEAAAIVTTICPAETQGFDGCAPGLALADAVHTRLDGPRPPSDVRDVVEFYPTRWGGPRRIVNARGHVTTIERKHPVFPMLVTATVKHNGFRTEAVYNDRALLEESRAIDPLDRKCTDGTCNAVTKYVWHPSLNRVTRVTGPELEVAEFDYNTSNGNLTWQQDGRGIASRINYDYGADGLLRGITLPGGARESVDYDPQLGNLSLSRSARGLETRYETDLFGRTRVVRKQIERGNLSFWQDDSASYDVMDRLRRAVSHGPEYKTIKPQSLIVEHFPDAEGADTLVTRRSRPDTTKIGVISTWFHYDALGRKIAEIAPDSAWEEFIYDEAGNVREVHTRRNDPKSGGRLVIRMEYDELNRLKVRRMPQVHYGVRSGVGIPPVQFSTVEPDELHSYPRYPNDGADGYLIAADVATFDYDPLGDELTVADNADAQVRRDYYPNGQLRTETQRIRTTAGSDFQTHEYELRYTYDLSGRLKQLRHPPTLSPAPTQPLTTDYDYDRPTGLLSTVTDGLRNVFTFKFNLRGELESVTRPGGIVETFGHDADGLLERHLVANGSSSPYRSTSAYLRNTTFTYDARGKILTAVDSHGPMDDMTAVYSGLGHLVGGTLKSNGRGHVPDACYNTSLRMDRGEDIRYDAFANATVSVTVTRLNFDCGYMTPASGVTHGYAPRTGRLAWTDRWESSLNYVIQRDVTRYDGAGNSEFGTHEWFTRGAFASQVILNDRAAYYAADGALRASDTRTLAGVNRIDRVFASTFEEYRYDALGRRVWVRARRYCEFDAYPATCNLDKVLRTVWDGGHELYEIQMPGGTNSAYLENDTSLPPLPMEYFADDRVDPNPFFGRVAYTHALGIDRPLSVIRIGYGDQVDVNNAVVSHRALEPFAIFPLWNARGPADLGVFADGGLYKCEQRDGRTRCVYIGWPGTWFAYDRPTFNRTFWHGSVIEDKKDASGLHYRRSRQYDPATGRFTQEDPIGLAGGMNLYGFAGGDPVNYGDPFGTCALAGAVSSVAMGASLALASGSNYGIGSAAFDAVTGAVCVGAIVKGIKMYRAAKMAKRMAAVRAAGRAGEEAAGIAKNTKRIPAPSGSAKYRVPDGLTETKLTEVKNVAKLDLTDQIRDFADYANKQNLEFELVIRKTTELSEPLQEFIKKHNITIRYLP